ncbi:MAG: 50S ribosomal protein L29 [Verrucomicrobiaceae bacterium TMED137]|jgi:large subunit ribosomal protein L29|nr:MAG: 50S ribosomal protein L29 [Verrucomicrobiaceae bacterium TMED137]RZN89949.1 MAG: 50S ribosomal protein L29 [Verrucomicrobiaceae bacterium]HAE20243.1 50S ribosomal protein L29 [Verrucomicrobiales bacterium]HCN80637.1 50S ribosomal protein L29 [Verrucomicrobiales bacterium]HCQ79334.1 50S ribosomal protein L29 [Verrucomicrobiales bacterium]|tara:strand:+ start:767 stop:967 length:201 start_codon:yes stop_codon:yes gene_type:complete
MPKVKFSEISELSPEELSTRLRELKAEGLTLRLQQATGQLENTARRRIVRREIAQVMTAINQRKSS